MSSARLAWWLLFWWLGFGSGVGAAPVPLTASTPVLMVADTPVTWDAFHFWLRQAARHYKNRHALPPDQPLNRWDALDEHGRPLGEQLLIQAQQLARQSLAIERQAQAAGLDLNAQELAAITAEQQRQIRIYTRVEYERIVVRMYGSQAMFTFLTRLDRLGQRLFAHLYGPQGERCSDAEVMAYVTQSQLIHLRYLFIPRSQPQAEAQARALRATMVEAPDPGPLLEAAIRAHGRDEAMQDEPDGRLVHRSQLPPAVALAHDLLSAGRLSEVIPTDTGFYVVQRLPVTPDVVTAGQTLRYWAAYQHLFKPAVARWAEALPVHWTEAFTHIDLARLNL